VVYHGRYIIHVILLGQVSWFWADESLNEWVGGTWSIGSGSKNLIFPSLLFFIVRGDFPITDGPIGAGPVDGFY